MFLCFFASFLVLFCSALLFFFSSSLLRFSVFCFSLLLGCSSSLLLFFSSTPWNVLLVVLFAKKGFPLFDFFSFSRLLLGTCFLFYWLRKVSLFLTSVLESIFLVFSMFLDVFGVSTGRYVLPFAWRKMLHEKAEASFLHTCIMFWLVFQVQEAPGELTEGEKTFCAINKRRQKHLS